MAVYDIKVKVKTKDGNTATRTLISGMQNGIDENSLQSLLSAYQKISTDKLERNDNGAVQVTIQQSNDVLIEGVATIAGSDYLSSADTLTISGTQGLSVKNIRITAAATYDTIQGATYTRQQYMQDVRAYGSAMYRATNNEWIPVTATLAQTTKDTFSADEDG